MNSSLFAKSMQHVALWLLIGIASCMSIFAQENRGAGWSAKLDAKVKFYQTTEFGALLVGTEKSLYAVDAATGETLWRRKNVRLDETDVAPVPGTDLLLLTLEKDGKSRLAATDILTGDALWQSDKVKGAVMQMAVDPRAGLLAVVLIKDAKERARAGYKKKPRVYVFKLASGEELWNRETEGDVEMMPARWSENEAEEVPYTLDNYRAPLFLDGRLYLFYEGVTWFDAQTGKEREREKFRVNEEGLALTEADPVVDERYIYTSGSGRVRAFSRTDGKEIWTAKDLGVTPEMILTPRVLYVRTGGQFTRLKDGEPESKGDYGVSALDAATGKTLWRYKGADKGITNLALPDNNTIIIADRDDLIWIDATTGKRRLKVEHKIEGAAFVLINENGQAVVGGRNELRAFDARDGRLLWRARYTPPGRGILRTVTAIAARAAALYFRYGGVATNVFRGVQVARAIGAASSLRWSGLAARFATPYLTDLAADSARDYVAARFTPFGLAVRLQNYRRTGESLNGARDSISNARPRSTIVSRLPTPARGDVEERLLDRIDPAHQLERFASFLWRRERLAALRGEFMYFYTDLPDPYSGNGLIGVNLNNGRAEQFVRTGAPDPRFTTDDTTGLLYMANDERLMAIAVR